MSHYFAVQSEIAKNMRKKTQSEKNTGPTLRKEIAKIKGWCVKRESPGVDGSPDYDVYIYPFGLYCAVETKSQGDDPKPHQLNYHRKLKRQGVRVYVIDTREKVLKLVAKIKRDIKRYEV